MTRYLRDGGRRQQARAPVTSHDPATRGPISFDDFKDLVAHDPAAAEAVVREGGMSVPDWMAEAMGGPRPGMQATPTGDVRTLTEAAYGLTRTPVPAGASITREDAREMAGAGRSDELREAVKEGRLELPWHVAEQLGDYEGIPAQRGPRMESLDRVTQSEFTELVNTGRGELAMSLLRDGKVDYEEHVVEGLKADYEAAGMSFRDSGAS